MTSWPIPRLQEFAQVLPFEHLLRKRSPHEAVARWKVESQAYAHARPCRVGLLLAADADISQSTGTVASWQLQTWPGIFLVLIGKATDPGLQALRSAFLPASSAIVEKADPGTLARLGIDWVIPAAAGDLLHPSLAGIVAQHAAAGAEGVAWDWFSASRKGRGVKLISRRRGPWRDDLAELTEDLRYRAFALPADGWDGHPVADAWRVRMRVAGAEMKLRIHPEPLGIYAVGQADRKPDAAMARERWGVPFEQSPIGLRPAQAAAGVSVIILYRDRAELTLKAIASVLAQNIGGQLQLVLVDNQSTETTKTAIDACIRALPNGVTATVLLHDEPFNHSRQCNLAARAASEEVLVFMNNDVELLDRGALDRMARWARIPGLASVGVRVVDAEGRTAGGGFRARRIPGAEFNSPVEEASGTAGERSRTTVGNTFACAAVSASAFRALGGLDELAFPVGYNDVDYCLRAVRQSWRHVNLADVRVSHAVGASRARTDEIAQKLSLRCAHPWLAVRALLEIELEPVVVAEVILPALACDIATPSPGALS